MGNSSKQLLNALRSIKSILIDQNKPSKLEKVAFTLSIIGIIITLWLGCEANRIGNTSLSLAEKADTTKNLLDSLAIVITNQQKQIVKLQDIDSILVAESRELKYQGKNIFGQLQISQKQDSISNSAMILQRKIDSLSFSQGFEQVLRLDKQIRTRFRIRPYYLFNELQYNRTVEYLESLKATVQGQLKNAYLLSHPDLYGNWLTIDSYCANLINAFVYSLDDPPYAGRFREEVTMRFIQNEFNTHYNDFYKLTCKYLGLQDKVD